MSVAVIGAGIAGFSAAIEAAMAGREVVLYDGREHPGGRARTRTVAGFRVNEGAHALYLGGPANAFLRELGCEPAGGAPATGDGLGIDGDVVGTSPGGCGRCCAHRCSRVTGCDSSSCSPASPGSTRRSSRRSPSRRRWNSCWAAGRPADWLLPFCDSRPMATMWVTRAAARRRLSSSWRRAVAFVVSTAGGRPSSLRSRTRRGTSTGRLLLRRRVLRGSRCPSRGAV